MRAIYIVRQPGFVVVERNVCNTLLASSGYCMIYTCPASFICTSQAPGIFSRINQRIGWSTTIKDRSTETQPWDDYHCR